MDIDPGNGEGDTYNDEKITVHVPGASVILSDARYPQNGNC